MIVGESYRAVGEGPLRIWKNGEKILELGSNRLGVLQPNTGTSFLVVEGPIVARGTDVEYYSKRPDKGEVLSYRILAPDICGWIFIWKSADDKLDKYGSTENEESYCLELITK